MTSLPDGEPGGKQVLRCALFSTTPPPPDKVEAETAAWPAAKTDELRTELDRAAQIEGSEKPVAGVPELPVLGPRIYAKLHRGAAVITGDDWFAELNLSPMNRIVAGLGTRVVQRDQEQLMQSAWAQLGEVEKANRAIALAQLAELLASRVHSRLSDLLPSRLLQVAAPLGQAGDRDAGKDPRRRSDRQCDPGDRPHGGRSGAASVRAARCSAMRMLPPATGSARSREQETSCAISPASTRIRTASAP